MIQRDIFKRWTPFLPDVLQGPLLSFLLHGGLLLSSLGHISLT